MKNQVAHHFKVSYSELLLNSLSGFDFYDFEVLEW